MEEKPDFLQAVVYLSGEVTDMVFREACREVARQALLGFADGTEWTVPAAARRFDCEVWTIRTLLGFAGTEGFEDISFSELPEDRFQVFLQNGER